MTEETVLFVDPDVIYLRFLRAVVEKEGIQARYATNAADAWRILTEGPCSLMILAMEMPGSNGETLAMMARELHPDIEILAVTDEAPSIVHAALAAALPEPVAKPITVAEILDVMRRHAADRKSARSPGSDGDAAARSRG